MSKGNSHGILNSCLLEGILARCVDAGVMCCFIAVEEILCCMTEIITEGDVDGKPLSLPLLEYAESLCSTARASNRPTAWCPPKVRKLILSSPSDRTTAVSAD